MSVCRTVSEIFSIKEWHHLETGGRGRSMSLKMAPFDRSYMTFYWSAIVSIALSCTVFELYVGPNLIHDFTAVTCSVKLAFFREIRLFP